MKHCLIMTAYKDAEAINRFIELTPLDWGIYIHVDKKTNIDKEINSRATIFKLKKIYWGSWEHTYVICELLKYAYTDASYDYYHIVSGQDLYAMSPNMIKDYCKNGNNYISAFSIPFSGWKTWGGRLLYFRISDIGFIL